VIIRHDPRSIEPPSFSTGVERPRTYIVRRVHA
jgi:hypothetical protein